MIEPRDPDLDAFVELLRSGTPRPEQLAIARAGVLGRAAAPTSSAASILLKLGLLGVVLVTGGASSGAWTTAAAKASPRLEPVAIATAEIVEEPRPSWRPRRRRPNRSRRPHPSSPRREPRPPAPLVIDVGPIPAAPVGPIAPSETMASALRDVDARRWSQAAGKLQEVVDGRTGDLPDRVEEAEHLLAKSLFALGLHHAAAAAFEPVTRAGPAHPWFAASLPMLAEIAAAMPEPGAVVRAIDAYDPEAIEALGADRASVTFWLLGRQRATDGRDDAALEALARVPDDARHGLEARFLEGALHARHRRPGPALRAFARVAEGTGPAEPLHELAWLNLARLRYALAAQRPAGDERGEALLRGALAAWRHVPQSSPRWADAFAEETWALYLAGDVDRALGHAHALTAPALRERASPEPQVVRAMIQLEHCQWDAAAHTVARFSSLMGPRLRDTDRAVDLARTRDDALRVLVAVRAGRSRVPPRVLPEVREALSDRELTRHLDQLRSIELEQRRLARDPTLLEGDVATRVSSDLAIARSLAADRTGEHVQVRLRRLASGLRDVASRMDTVELELTTERRRELDYPNRTSMEPAEGGPIVGLAGGQLWPFDGEWWPDEMAHYRQSIRNRCGR